MSEFNLTQEEVAKKVEKKDLQLLILRILKLPREVALMIQREELSMGMQSPCRFER